MNPKIKKMLADLEARKKGLVTKSEASTDINEVRSIHEQLGEIDNEIQGLTGLATDFPEATETRANAPENKENNEGEEIEARGATITPQGLLTPLAAFGAGANIQTADDSEARSKKFEQRGKDLKAGKEVTYGINELPITSELAQRSTTIATSGLVIPKNTATTINPTFNEVSGLLDMVKTTPLEHGESYEVPFDKPLTDEAGTPASDGGDYTNVDPVTDYATIGKAVFTGYNEISKQVLKATNIDYQAQQGIKIRLALRKKLAKEIMVGSGATGHFTGIFNAPSNIIPTDSDLTISEIDADTLDDIVFSYGGDEDVEGQAGLILNKNDLKAFAAVRGSDGKKLYKIKKNGATGTISSEDSTEVPFVINSACSALSSDSTAEGTYCMAYGNFKNYEMAVYSPVTVAESKDYKFKQGMIAYAGEVYAGGNVVAYKGFVRVKKG